MRYDYITKELAENTTDSRIANAYDSGDLSVVVYGSSYYFETARVSNACIKAIHREIKRLFPGLVYSFN